MSQQNSAVMEDDGSTALQVLPMRGQALAQNAVTEQERDISTNVVADSPATEHDSSAAHVDEKTLFVSDGSYSSVSTPSSASTDKQSAVVKEVFLSKPAQSLPHKALDDLQIQSSEVTAPNTLRNPAPVQEQACLPDYDRSLKTRQQCIAATFIGAVLSLFCFIFGLIIALRDPHNLALRLPIPIQDNWNEAISLVINLIIGFANDGMAFAHSCSLRWALLAEGRLEYNTNIRLFTHARSSPPNRRPANILSLASLILCYGASSMLIVGGEPEDRERDITCWNLGFQVDSEYAWVNATALCALGVGLGTQAALAGWCIYMSMPKKGSSIGSTVPSWNSDPLNTTLTALNLGLFTRRPGRAMLSVHRRNEPSSASNPLPQQKSIWALRQSSVRVVLILVWTYALLSVAAPLIVIMIPKTLSCVFCLTWNNPCSGDQEDYGLYHKNFAEFSMWPGDLLNAAGEATIPYFWECLLGVLYVSCFQGTQTCGLHAVELVVNMSRDEAAWRRATSRDGAKPVGGDDSLTAAMKSWENGVLFVAKAVLHWIIGEAMMPTIDPRMGKFWLCVAYSRLMVYAILAISTALFTTWLATRGYSGPQPAALGNVQTLADLIDDWNTNDKGRFWWGDKSSAVKDVNREVSCRHAGTGKWKDELGTVSIEHVYV